jgi:hypothetical protein
MSDRRFQYLLDACITVVGYGGELEYAINLFLVCVGARPGARLEFMYEAVVDRADQRGSETDKLLVSELNGAGRALKTAFRKGANPSQHIERISHLFDLLLEEHGGRILEDLRKVCDVHGVLVIPSRMEPYVIGKALQADKALLKRLVRPGFDEQDDEAYATLAKTLGYPVVGIKTKRTGQVSIVIDTSDGRSVKLMTCSFDDSSSSRKTVRTITDHTCVVARKALVGLKVGSGAHISDVRCTVERFDEHF